MKKLLLLMAFLTTAGIASAQVGVNTTTPHASAVLDVVSTNKGVLIPRMTTAQKLAITNPATGLLVYDTNDKCICQNQGTPALPSWVCLAPVDDYTKWFYMPSISIDASVTRTGQTLNLYAEYKKQFSDFTGTKAACKSAGAPVDIPYFALASDLYYYVTSYDNTVVKINSINVSGVMNYDIIKESVFGTFMNIVFVVNK